MIVGEEPVRLFGSAPAELVDLPIGDEGVPGLAGAEGHEPVPDDLVATAGVAVAGRSDLGSEVALVRTLGSWLPAPPAPEIIPEPAAPSRSDDSRESGS